MGATRTCPSLMLTSRAPTNGPPELSTDTAFEAAQRSLLSRRGRFRFIFEANGMTAVTPPTPSDIGGGGGYQPIKSTN